MAFQIATSLGDRLQEEGYEAYTNTSGDYVPAKPNGGRILLDLLRKEFAPEIQDQSVSSLEAFFSLDRNQTNMTMPEFITAFNLMYADAANLAQMQMNNVCKSFLLLSKSGLTQKQKHEYLLQIGGDLSRYAELESVLLRFGKMESVKGTDPYSLSRVHWQEHEQQVWQDESWTYQTQSDDWGWQADEWQEDSWNYWPQGDDQYHEQPSHQPAGDSQEFYGKGKGRGKGKGKGKGSGCAICGSPYHWKNECPTVTGQSSKGTGWTDETAGVSPAPELEGDEGAWYYPEPQGDDGQYWGKKGRKGKGKGKGKSKGFKGKGKSKGKSKGNHYTDVWDTDEWSAEAYTYTTTAPSAVLTLETMLNLALMTDAGASLSVGAPTSDSDTSSNASSEIKLLGSFSDLDEESGA